MSEGGRAIRRGLVVAIAVWSLFSACVYVFSGMQILLMSSFETRVVDGRVGTQYVPHFLYGAFLLLYAAFLAVTGHGLLREKDWGWRLGMVAGAIPILFAVLDARRREWGFLAYDLGYSAFVLGSLLWVRRSGAAENK